MKLPAHVLATRDRYVDAFPLWVMPAGPAAEERARTWALGLAAQVTFEHPDQGWGSKRADKNRPISKDTISQQSATKILCWDLLSGAGSGSPTLVDSPDSIDISDQVFVVVQPQDVIGMLGGEDLPGGGGGPEPAPVIPYNEAYAVEFGLACNAVYVESGAAFDPGMIAVHSARAAYDYYVGGMTWPDSMKKHINEFRAVYGLPPV